MLGIPKRAAALALALAALTLGACGGGDDETGSPSGSTSAPMDHETTVETIPAAEAEVTVDVTLKDFEIAGVPETIEGEKILFKVRNEGPTEHELVLLKGTEELVEVEGMDAGGSGELAVKLQPGRYTAKCLIGSGGARHDKLGMVANFTVV